ncbi:MAG: hypothetical protein ACRDKW_08185, partial [Actinomycetota bacterium]
RAQFSIPPLPAPDAAALAATMQARMEALQRLRIEEVLRPASPPVEARYAFEAPDRMHMALITGPETVTIGATRYSRQSLAAPWEIAQGIPTTHHQGPVAHLEPPSVHGVAGRGGRRGAWTPRPGDLVFRGPGGHPRLVPPLGGR